MSENSHDLLHQDEDFSIAVAPTPDGLWVVLESQHQGFSLDRDDDVILIWNGQALAKHEATTHRVTAMILAEDLPGTLLVRIDEFFDGWDLFGQAS